MEAGLTNVYIDSILFKYCPQFYRGTFSCDTIPSKLSHVSTYGIIVNHSKESAQGSHFVSIISFPTYVLYLDSYALPCMNTDICSFLVGLNKSVFYNTTRLQDVSSNHCGFYAMYFVLYFSHKNNVKAKFRSDDLLKNDDLCTQYICELIKKD